MEYVTSDPHDPDEPTRKITKVRNVLHVENVDRKTLNSVFTCQATNSRLVHPISSTITLDVNCKYFNIALIINDNDNVITKQSKQIIATAQGIISRNYSCDRFNSLRFEKLVDLNLNSLFRSTES